MRFSTILALGLGVGLCATAPAFASTALAEYTQVGNNRIIVWTHGVNGSILSTAALTGNQMFNTYFTFQNPSLASIVNVDTLFTLNGTTSSAATMSGNTLTQPDVSGSFSFIYEGATPLVVGTHSYAAGTNLLSGTFSGANVSGQVGGSTGNLLDSIFGGGTVVFTSGIDPSQLQFAAGGDKGLSLAFNALNHPLSHSTGSSLNSFKATTAGNFAADLSVGGGGGGVPEPATWALMLIGVGGIGTMLRRRIAQPAAL